MIKKSIKPEFMWPTPCLSVFHKEIDEFNVEMARIIKHMEGEIVGKGKATPVAGWTTEALTTKWL